MRYGFAALLLVVVLFPVHLAGAQDMELTPESRLWIEGTSNRSDWTVYAKNLSARATRSTDAVAPVELEVTIPSGEITSDESTIMDRLMHEALKVAEHPTITYELVEARPADGSEGVLTTTGRLTLAGVTNEIVMDVEAEQLDDGSVRFTGTTPLKMTDFEMRPPTAMFGSLRTGDDVTVHFDVTFSPAG